MCGIAGLWDRRRGVPGLRDVATTMANALAHRGPDDSGTWIEQSEGLALAHRRLSILELSTAGHQPMESACGRYVVAFNGEIYNHLELRELLERAGAAPSWRGHSDTETLLAACSAWGLPETLRQATGMFAFALWDRAEHSLALARDRLGEKPLYYGWQAESFLFASEPKALRTHPAWQGRIDRAALTRYMRVGYVPTPHSIWQGISKLLPGTFLVLTRDDPVGDLPAPKPYWRAVDVASVGAGGIDDAEAIESLDDALRQAVRRQMIADVPLGAFLSGGVDSSVIVALMQSQASRPVRTFSVGFAEADYDEAPHARAVAAHLGTDHTELLLSAAEARDVIPHLPEIYDEPFGDSSQIPTHLVAKLARQHVAVSLSGDGGDELFGGYNRYVWGSRLWQRVGGVPSTIRTFAGALLASLSPTRWDELGGRLPKSLRLPALGDKLHKLAGVLDAADADDLYQRLIAQQRESESIVLGAYDAELWAEAQAREFAGDDLAGRMMFHDLVGYLSDDILVKVDRAAMAVSLETRVPFLDHHVVEFAWRLPPAMKIRNGQGKWLLREVLYRYVPRELVERPKQGFGIPLDGWLRRPLRDWAETLLDEQRLRREGYLDAVAVRKKWAEHLSGRRNWQHWLWNVLMFQAWQERWP